VKTWAICHTDNAGTRASGYCWGYGDCAGSGNCNCTLDPGWVENAGCPTTQAGNLTWN
jgi:hypothetical protein